MTTRVLIGCPTWEGKRDVVSRWWSAVQALKGDICTCDVLLADNSKSDAFSKELEALGIPVIRTPWHEKARDRIVAARNALREHALAKAYDWFFSLEQDVFPSPDDLQRLLSHNKRIVSGVVYNNYLIEGKPLRLPMVWFPAPNDPEGLIQARPEQVQQQNQQNQNSLLKVRATSLSCLLIHKNVLEKIRFRYAGEAFDDMLFCKDAQEAGFEIFLDTGVRPEHIGGNWKDIE